LELNREDYEEVLSKFPNSVRVAIEKVVETNEKTLKVETPKKTNLWTEK
jgi:hypothetical protein